MIKETSPYAKKKKKSRMCAFGKRRYEEWNYIFVKGKESNFALT